MSRVTYGEHPFITFWSILPPFHAVEEAMWRSANDVLSWNESRVFAVGVRKTRQLTGRRNWTIWQLTVNSGVRVVMFSRMRTNKNAHLYSSVCRILRLSFLSRLCGFTTQFRLHIHPFHRTYSSQCRLPCCLTLDDENDDFGRSPYTVEGGMDLRWWSVLVGVDYPQAKTFVLKILPNCDRIRGWVPRRDNEDKLEHRHSFFLRAYFLPPSTCLSPFFCFHSLLWSPLSLLHCPEDSEGTRKHKLTPMLHSVSAYRVSCLCYVCPVYSALQQNDATNTPILFVYRRFKFLTLSSTL